MASVTVYKSTYYPKAASTIVYNNGLSIYAFLWPQIPCSHLCNTIYEYDKRVPFNIPYLLQLNRLVWMYKPLFSLLVRCLYSVHLEITFVEVSNDDNACYDSHTAKSIIITTFIYIFCNTSLIFFFPSSSSSPAFLDQTD